VPTGVRNLLVAVQFGGNTAIVQGTIRNVAGGQIQQVAAKQW